MQTIGERLEEGRKRKGISIREAAEATKIRGEYLQRFENNQFDINLSEIYVRGFLRTYCNLLKLPADRIISDFRAMGHDSELKPKPPSREVYGRMEVTHASASGSTKSAKDDLPANDGSGDGEDGPNTRTFARIGTSLPTGTFIDQRIFIKIGAGLLAVVVLLLVVWGIRSVASSGARVSAADRSKPLVEERMITFTALDTVQLKVSLKRSEQDTVGEEFFSGKLMRGESKVLPRRGNLYVLADQIENIEVEADGKKMRPSAYNFHGNQRILLPSGN